MPESPSTRRYLRALHRLTRWRLVLTGWQLGTRDDQDPEGRAVRDHREATLIQRAELSAVIRVLIEGNLVTEERFRNYVADESDWLSESMEERFPGFRATDAGIEIFDMEKAAETMEGWRP